MIDEGLQISHSPAWKLTNWHLAGARNSRSVLLQEDKAKQRKRRRQARKTMDVVPAQKSREMCNKFIAICCAAVVGSARRQSAGRQHLHRKQHRHSSFRSISEHVLRRALAQLATMLFLQLLLYHQCKYGVPHSEICIKVKKKKGMLYFSIGIRRILHAKSLFFAEPFASSGPAASCVRFPLKKKKG